MGGLYSGGLYSEVYGTSLMYLTNEMLYKRGLHVPNEGSFNPCNVFSLRLKQCNTRKVHFNKSLTSCVNVF